MINKYFKNWKRIQKLSLQTIKTKKTTKSQTMFKVNKIKKRNIDLLFQPKLHRLWSQKDNLKRPGWKENKSMIETIKPIFKNKKKINKFDSMRLTVQKGQNRCYNSLNLPDRSFSSLWNNNKQFSLKPDNLVRFSQKLNKN